MNLATSCLFRAMRNISVNPISWQKKLKIFRDLSAGVAFIHAAGIVHGDMKPSNVLLDSSFNCKIADFGGSRNNTSLRVDKKIVITLQYVPKETIKNGLVGPPMDVFAVGRIIWELSCDGRIVDINDAADVLDFIPSGIEEIVKYACDEDWKTRANALQLIDSLISFEIDYSTLTIQSFGDSKVIVTNNDKEEYEASIDQSQKQLSQAMSLSTELNFENVDPITRSQAKHSLSRSTKSSSSFTNYRSSPRDESKFSLNRKVTNLSVERLKRSVSVKSGPFANSVNSSFDPTESPSTFWARYIEDTCSISQFVDRIRFIYPTFLASEIAMKSLSDPHVLGTVTLASFESFVALYSESINDQISSAFSKFCMSSCHPTSQELSQTKIWNEISRRGSALKDGLITDSDDINAMHCAARNGFADIVELMLFVDSVFTFKISTWFCFQLNKRGFNACHIAVLCNKLDCVRLFLDSGLVDEKTSDGSTALSLAISSGSVDVVKMILKAGANVNIKDDSGVTPALVAAFGTNITILRLITENPTAKIDIKNKKGLFPLQCVFSNLVLLLLDVILKP